MTELLMAAVPAVMTIAAALLLPLVLHKLFEKNRLLSCLFLGQRMRVFSIARGNERRARYYQP
jgi:hypothetical protein